MKVKTIPSTWITREGRRLDCGPFMSGALEARMLLAQLSCRKDRLQDVTRDGMDGIVNAGRVKRLWVESPEYGIPFLSSTDILQADLSSVPFISNKVVRDYPQLVIRQGWTLITRSGTIGRMVYARPDMDGMGCSEHVMRVIPDTARISSGYLYAFLSSKFGVPMVVGGTYGSIIQSIEPHHIADLPVPRLGDAVEQRAHALVEEAARLRSAAAAQRQMAIQLVTNWLGWEPVNDENKVASASSSEIQRRLDAFHHSLRVQQARVILSHTTDSRNVKNVVREVFEPNRGARIKVDSAEFGIPFLSSSEVFSLDPTGEYLISKRRTNALDRLLIEENDLLLPRSGQLGGIIGRAVLPLPTYYGHAASEHLVRVRCHSHDDACYLWAIFGCEPGYYATIGTAYGSSIPSLDCELIGNLLIPWEQGELRTQVVTLVSTSLRDATNAIYLERQAVRSIEQAIEGVA